MNVALRDAEGRALTSVSADPLADELFWADDSGAHVRRAGADRAIAPSPESRLVAVNCDEPLHEPFVDP